MWGYKYSLTGKLGGGEATRYGVQVFPYGKIWGAVVSESPMVAKKQSEVREVHTRGHTVPTPTSENGGFGGYAPKYGGMGGEATQIGGLGGYPPHVSSMGGGWDMKNARRGKGSVPCLPRRRTAERRPPVTPPTGGGASIPLRENLGAMPPNRGYKFSRKGILLGCAAKRRLRRGESDYF